MMWTFILLAPVILVSSQLSNNDLSTLNRDCHSVYDAVLVIDGSESIGLNNFNTIKRALMEFVNQTLQPNKDVHLGVVLYSTGVVETVNLTSDWVMLDNRINAMSYPARATFTDTGIEAATAMLLEQGRNVVPRILIVVTDGLSSRPDRTLAAADAAKSSSITIYSVGIEVYVKQNADILARYQAELSSIASDEGHVIHLEDFNEFENNAPELAQKFCAVVADVVSGLQNLTVFVGDTFTLTAAMSHTAVVGGNWTLNGVPLSDGGRISISSNGSFQNLTVEGAMLSDAGDYVFTVGGQSAHGYVTVDTATITQGLVDQSLSVGAQVVFQVTLSQAGITGEWFKDGVSLSGDTRYQTQSSGTSQFMFFTGAQVSDSGTYTFTANGQSTSAQLTVTGSSPINGNWGEWTQWSTPGCPASCGSAARHTVTRRRSCDSPPPNNLGNPCSGESNQSESRMCGPSTCDTVTITQGLVDQSLSVGAQVVFQVTLSQAAITGEWFKDGVSLRGDPRYQTQSSGNSQFMFFTGAQVSDSGTYTFNANGLSTSAQLTVTGSSPINGNWGEWTQWSTPGCPASCGSAARHTVTRRRSCDNPPPNNLGNPCSGESNQSESRMCGPSTCDTVTITQGLVDQSLSVGAQVVFQVTLSQAGITGEWFKDGVSLSGEPRYQTSPSGNSQFMFFTGAQVSDSGTYTFTANGQSTSARLTVTGSSPINGNWGEWTQWSTPGCPASCGSAARHTVTRRRSCDNPPPNNLGNPCSGESNQSESRMCGPSTCDTVTITQGLVDQSVSVGAQVVFQVTLSQAGITGEWFKDGVSLSGEPRYQTSPSGNSQFMFFTGAQVSDSGTYTFTANGQSTSAQLTVTGSSPINGNWGEWTQWSTPGCPASCGSAARHTVTRRRSCDSPPPNNLGNPCSGESNQTESRMCGPSTCDTVTITQGLVDQSVSVGAQVVFQVTLSQAGITGEWFKDGVSLSGEPRYQTSPSGNSQFMFFTGAQVSDSGTYTFTANGQSTSAQLTVTGSSPINGNWGEWTQWSTPGCPASCGSAARHTVTRRRSCDNPPPDNLGNPCSGESDQTESRMCGPSTCDTVTITQGLVDQSVSVGAQVVFQVTLSQEGITGEWFKDGVSLSGDPRYQTSPSGNSQFMFFTGAQVSDSGTYTFTANGQSTSAQLTVTGSSPINGNWGEWTQWSTPGCPASCGSAARHTVTRRRSCDNPPPNNLGNPCPGESDQTESRMCGPSTCDTVTITQGLVDQSVSVGAQVVFQVTLSQAGITGEWFKDGVSLSGDSRYQTSPSGNSQFMFFTGAQVSDSGTYTFTANGQSTSAQLTVTGSSPINGNWGEWTQWSTPGCPASCGSAARHTVTRRRSCDSPPPNNLGNPCSGESNQSESRMCGPSTCVTFTQGLVDQTVPMGSGVTFRVTLSQAGTTGEWFKDGIKLTGGSKYQIYFAGGSNFLYFTDASETDSGTYTFTSNGQSTSAQLRVTDRVNGNWGEWTQWSTPGCPASCGSAARHTVTRRRFCDSPLPSNGGSPCVGETSQSESRMCGSLSCVFSIGFTTELRDTRARLGGDFILTAVVNRTDLGSGQWTKGGQVLTMNNRLTLGSDGTGRYTLRVTRTEDSDQGQYTFNIGGISSECRVTVVDCHSVYDAVLVVDGSESIGLNNFNTIKRALMEFVNQTLQPNKDVHLGVVLYSTGVVETVNLTSDWAMLDNRINAMVYPARATFTDTGIEAATAMLLEQGRNVVPRILIVVTDGLSSRPDRTLAAADAAKSSSITIYSVGIEVYVRQNDAILARYQAELSSVASDEGHVIHLEDFNEFENIAPELAQKFCAVVADVVSGLQNLTVYIGDTFTLTAQMSHTAVVGGTWALNGVALSEGGRVSFVQNGSLLHLRIQDVTAGDSGRYSYSVGGKSAVGYVRVQASWAAWSDWVSSPCAATCGVGVTEVWRRTRTCRESDGLTCFGHTTESSIRPCSDEIPNCYGTWSDWSRWSSPACPVCGQPDIRVQIIRGRVCNKERRSDEDCPGSRTDASLYGCTLNQCTNDREPSSSDRATGTVLAIVAGVVAGLMLV